MVGKVAMMFAGQGAQFPGMGKQDYQNSKAAKSIFDALALIKPDILSLCFDSDKLELSKTINAQPALFAVGLASAYAWCEKHNKKPSMLAGFSLGEIPALVFCGALGLDAGFELVCKRAEFMSECAAQNEGGMAAVLGLQADIVKDIVQGFDQLWCANFNAPTQTVIAGSLKDLDNCANLIAGAKGKMIRLAVSGAFHTPFMRDAADKLGRYIEGLQFGDFDIPMYSNVDGKLYTKVDTKKRIVQQIYSPVQWVDTVVQMRIDGVTDFVEVGVGNVLTGLVNKIVNRSL